MLKVAQDSQGTQKALKEVHNQDRAHNRSLVQLWMETRPTVGALEMLV